MASFAGTFGQPRSLCGGVVLVACLAGLAHPALATEPPAGSGEDPSSKAEILSAMQEVRGKYGSDAVLLQGHLLSHAVRSGSVGEAVVAVGGIEEHNGRRFLRFQLETGILYNDRDVSAAVRPARVWSDIVEASLRKFPSLTLPADGIVLALGYAHRDYKDEAELRARVSDLPGTPETVAFYLLLTDVDDLIAQRIPGQQLIERSAVLLNGAAAHILLVAPTPSVEESGH